MKKTLILLTSVTLLAVACRKDVSNTASTSGSTNTENTVTNPRLILPGSNGSGLSRIPAGYEEPTCSVPIERALMAGQSVNTGTVTIWNDATNVYVAYQMDGNYQIKKTHLYVGSCNTIPVNGAGNPRIGLYPYYADHGTGVAVYVYVIPRSSLPEGCICVSAHAEVVAYGSNGSVTFSQTGWANGEQLNDGGSWAMKFNYCIQDCDGGPR
jgi:hypothetical protein